MPEVAGAEPLRHQGLDGFAQQFIALVAKQLLHLRVDQDDLTLTVDHDHRVGRSLQQGTKLLLGPACAR